MTLGVWKPRKRHEDSELTRRLSALWFRIQMKHGVGNVQIRHVLSHIGVPGNELADKLAKAGMDNQSPASNGPRR